jgi:hypothetical protein
MKRSLMLKLLTTTTRTRRIRNKKE